MALSRRGVVMAALAAGLIALVAVFDWNWFIPAVERHFEADSNRDVHIDDLHLGFGDGFEPEVRLRGLRVQNAPWSSNPNLPMVVASEARFRFSWAGLIRRPMVITELALVDADVSLERRADGLRNWRLRRPDDTAPGRVVVQALNAQRSRIRFLHEGIGLDLRAESREPKLPLEPLRGEPLTRDIAFTGTFNGQPFDGQAFSGNRLTFRETGEFVPLRGHVRSGNSRIDVDGRAADWFRLTLIDADVRAKGPSLAALAAFLPVALPATKPYTLTAHLFKEQREFTLVKLDAEVGSTDLSGELKYDQSNERPRLEATLASRRADLSDLSSLLRTSPPAKQTEPRERLLSDKRFGAGKLRELDAEVELKVQTLNAPSLPPLQNVRLQARLEGGQFDVKPLQFAWAGGTVRGTLGLDASQDPPTAQLDVQWQKLRLETLLPDQPENARVAGPLSGRIVVNGRGDTLAALLGRGTGTVSAVLTGGSLPNKLDAKLSLNGGKWLKSLFTGTESIPIHCGELVADLRDGTLRTRHLVLETAQTRLAGTGQLDFGDERFELWLDPQPKKASLLSLPQSIRMRGALSAFDKTSTTLEAPREIDPGAGCDPGKPRAG
jgi:uncharacterized protein involved in outer membrane biogenesis